jgi:hypothetical protein
MICVGEIKKKLVKKHYLNVIMKIAGNAVYDNYQVVSNKKANCLLDR